MTTYYPKNAEETEALARSLAKTLELGDILCFFGNLGAGKTTFIKALAEAFQISRELINSPTFQYLHIYNACSLSDDLKNQNMFPFYHFDLYRLPSSHEFLASGFDEFLEPHTTTHQGIVCIEWAERILDLLPKKYIQISIVHDISQENVRKVEIVHFS